MGITTNYRNVAKAAGGTLLGGCLKASAESLAAF